ncbi:formylglycine-generating enzyme family protein [Flavobacterium rhizosphaerae]|uniref:Formylglycine-generating enzyme family protein n=1 Tax=Flavobacterium rhizosphaerae TaxID=3163298 RepID=A0ABW8Z0R4_9FLAO
MKNIIYIIVSVLLLSGCKEKQADLVTARPENIKTPPGMVWVPGKKFTQGAKENDNLAQPYEKPAHSVQVDGFFMDMTEVTNAQFKKFVAATGYITTAERPVDWEEMKKTVPPGTLKPADSLLVPGSMIFNRDVEGVTDYSNYLQWWKWQPGANWQHPYGKGSDINGKDNYPVVHISYEDALAYCKWANRRLPTEAEWEKAAMGSLDSSVYTWGNDKSKLNKRANTWQGSFPTLNIPDDGYSYLAPVKSFPANSLGLYEMAGNVWEFTQDWYNTDYYGQLAATGTATENPKGAATAFNPQNPYQPEKIIKGGSFLCNESYCSSFRISARMAMTMDSSSDHVGFRTVADPEMLK